MDPISQLSASAERLDLPLQGAARSAIGHLEPGCSIFGVNKGQFSMSDILYCLLEDTGPARMDCTVWTIGRKDIHRFSTMVELGDITEARWVFGASLRTRHPKYWALIEQLLDPSTYRVSETHAKMVSVINDDWSVALRGSMNLNRCSRLEHYEISEGDGVAECISSVIDQVFDSHSEEETASAGRSEVRKTFNAIGQGDTDALLQELL